MWSPAPDMPAVWTAGRDKPVPYDRCSLRVRAPAPGVVTRIRPMLAATAQVTNPIEIEWISRRSLCADDGWLGVGETDGVAVCGHQQLASVTLGKVCCITLVVS